MPMPSSNPRVAVERYFEFAALGADWKTEILAGFTTVMLGNLRDKSTLLALFGLMLIATLLARRVRGAMLIGILATTIAGLLTGVSKWAPQSYSLGDLAATAGKLDIAAASKIGFVE